MTERGKIREIKGKLITISPDFSDCCFGCMKMECKTSGGILNAENIKALPLEIGQTVELIRPEAPIVKQSIIALLPPVLGFILGYFLTRQFFPNVSEAAAVFGGVVKLFLTAFIVYKLRKYFPVKEYMRYVERVIV